MGKGRRPRAPGAPSTQATTAHLDPPEWLTADAVVEWDRVVPVLNDLGVIRDVDLAVLSTYCQTWADYCECRRTLAVEGLTVDGKLHPLARYGDTLLKQLRPLIVELGFTPASKGKVQLPLDAVDSEAAAFDSFTDGGR